MKILKYIFLLLVLLAVAATVFIATQDGKYTITQEKVILAPKEIVFGYVNDYQNWQNLGLLAGADTTATYAYSETTAGKGAFMNWKKGSTSGNVTTTNAFATDSLIQDATINGFNSGIKWAFKDTPGGVKVSITLQGQLSFTEKARALFSKNIHTSFERTTKQGLENLNTFLVTDIAKYEVEVAGEVKKTGVFYLGHATTTTRAEVSKTASQAFKGLIEFTTKNKITVTGSPFIIYKNYSSYRDTLNYILCLPIKDEIFTSPGSEYIGGRLNEFMALKTTLKGDYSHLPKAWKAAEKHMAENQLMAIPELPYIVDYTKGAQQSRRPSAWVTNLYVPLGYVAVPVQNDSLNTVMPAAATNVQPASKEIQKPKTTTPKKDTPASAQKRKTATAILPRKDSVN